LMMGGFAMQWTRSSRCASGAEHQFSHLWDMQHHTHHGNPPSHGFKVGVATLAVTRLYEHLLSLPLDRLSIEERVSAWPDWPELEKRIHGQYDIPEIARKAVEESRAKYVDRAALRIHLEKIKESWPALRKKLATQLIPAAELRTMLSAAGAPADSADIGIPSSRLRDAYRQAGPIRRRYTILDLADRSGHLETSLKALFPA
jgi:glycerol-1-phosphate dehydrogenase [NAD(P)+]